MITTDIPGRLDRLPWSRFHWMIVLGLGITWILDGLEVTVVGAIGSRLTDHSALGLTTAQVGLAGSIYLIGAVIGALAFGYATDRLGRKKLFFITLTWYVISTVATAFSWNFASFALFRLLTGLGIGGEYAAINSAIDELIPARRRGVVDLAINSTWWIGTAIGSVESIVVLNPHVIDQRYGWRLIFLSGAVLGLAIIFLRRAIPESPRWLLMHGRHEEAEQIVGNIEQTSLPQPSTQALEPLPTLTINTKHRTTYTDVLKTLFVVYRKRTLLAATLMITQAFLYNAIFFTYALVLTTYFGVAANNVGWYILPFALGNVLGPLCLGHFFDTIGRRIMITASYGISGILLLITAVLFHQHYFDALTITVAWSIIFFFASAGASSAYLTTSEIFPIETRATAIAIIYSLGTLIGGSAAPAIFGALIASKSVDSLVLGYVVGAIFMLLGATVEAVLGIPAERRSLEEIAAPLASA
jgi:MFS family permease